MRLHARPRAARLSLIAALLLLGTSSGAHPARGAAGAVPAVGLAASARDGARADSVSADLTPTSSKPWNPPAPVPQHEVWEDVVDAPGRIAGIPFSLLTLGIRGALVYADANDVIPKIEAHIGFFSKVGLEASPASLGDRTGFGGTLAFQPHFFRPFTASLSGSTGGYNRARLALEKGPGLVEYQADWRPHDLFFGVGSGSRFQDKSTIASQTNAARIVLRYPWRRTIAPPHPILDDPASYTDTPRILHGSVRAWAGPRDAVDLNGRQTDSKHPPIADKFPALATTMLGERVEHFVYGARVDLDDRSGRPHWWRGWRVSTSAERYDKPIRAFALQSASTPTVSFTRLEYEGEAGWSFWQDPRTLRAFVRVVDQRSVRGPGLFLLTDDATLGGGAGLSGFEPGRFRDFDSMLGRLTYIFPIARYMEWEVHAEAGEVMPHLGDARIHAFEHSYGMALRPRNLWAPIGSVGVDWSRDLVRVRFSIGGVE